MRYRREYTEGATYFFTVVGFRRVHLFDDPVRVAQLRAAFGEERERRPFRIDAIVIMPDHIHAVWTLPPEDADYSIRWRNIKSGLTHQIETENRPAVSARRQHKKEQAIWQPRFWEHRIRDERDYARHVVTFITIRSSMDTSSARRIGRTAVFAGISAKAFCRPIGDAGSWSFPTISATSEFE